MDHWLYTYNSGRAEDDQPAPHGSNQLHMEVLVSMLGGSESFVDYRQRVLRGATIVLRMLGKRTVEFRRGEAQLAIYWPQGEPSSARGPRMCRSHVDVSNGGRNNKG